MSFVADQAGLCAYLGNTEIRVIRTADDERARWRMESRAPFHRQLLIETDRRNIEDRGAVQLQGAAILQHSCDRFLNRDESTSMLRLSPAEEVGLPDEIWPCGS